MNKHTKPDELPLEPDGDPQPARKNQRGNAKVFVRVNDRLRETLKAVPGTPFFEYAPGHTDTSIAVEIGCSALTVQHVRYSCFGKMPPPRPAAEAADEGRFAALEAEMKALRDDLANAKLMAGWQGSHNALRGFAAAINERLEKQEAIVFKLMQNPRLRAYVEDAP